MGKKSVGISVKDRPLYDALRNEGLGKKKAARVTIAVADNKPMNGKRSGGTRTDYEDRTKDQLLQRARKLHINGRSSMSKAQLIRALRKA